MEQKIVSKWIVCVIYGEKPAICYQRFNKNDWEYWKSIYESGEIDLCYVAETELVITDEPYTPFPGILDLRELEKVAIDTALKVTNGVYKEAAKLLGISPRVLSYKMIEHYGIRKGNKTQER